MIGRSAFGARKILAGAKHWFAACGSGCKVRRGQAGRRSRAMLSTSTNCPPRMA